MNDNPFQLPSNPHSFSSRLQATGKALEDALTLWSPARWSLVGSYVVCPLEAKDIDVLFYLPVDFPASEANYLRKESEALAAGWVLGGSLLPLDHPDKFKGFASFTHLESLLNVLVTADIDFYQRFVGATQLARELRIVDKQSRVDLHSMVLYGTFDNRERRETKKLHLEST